MTKEELLEVIERAAREKVTKLKLSNCKLTSLPPEIGELRNLNILDLPDNELTSLPPEIGKLTNLISLNLASNKLKQIPPEIGKMTKLKGISLWNNDLTELPPEIGNLINLTNLRIISNKIKKLPPEIGELINLKYLELRGNGLISLPGEIGQVKNLIFLDVSANNLTIITPLIGQLMELRYLNLEGNKLTKLSPAIGKLTNLTYLNLSDNKLTSLPQQIGQLINLTELNLGMNSLTSLPHQIGQLKKITKLNIVRNKLTKLPANIGELQNIRELNVGANQLNSLPPQIVNLRKLWNLTLIGNYWLLQQMAVYYKQGRNSAVSTQPCDRGLAVKALKVVYQLIGRKEPKIVFCSSPYQVLKKINSKVQPLSKYELYDKLLHCNPFREGMTGGIDDRLNRQLNGLLRQQLHSMFNNRPHKFLLDNVIKPEFWADRASWFDFCISVLGGKNQKERHLYQVLAQNCGWIFSFEKICILCDRPRALRFDNEQRLHAEGEPAIQFADGFSVYAHHGVRLPAAYGKLHPEHWPAEWLLSEENAELRRVLIQGIGYDRICQELEANSLDTWQEYELLRINANVDWERMHLLKMTCPSTGYIHAIRVPPDVESAREAIRWVNWGVDPEEFSVES